MSIKITTDRGKERKLQIYAEIKYYQIENGYGPFQSEIAKKIGISEVAVGKYVSSLCKDGLVQKRFGHYNRVNIV